MSTPRVHYIGLDTPVSPGVRGLISKEICAQSAAVQKRSALFCHPSLIPVQSYLADLWYLQHIGTPEVPGGVVNFSSPPTTLLRHKEQPAPSHPPPSLLRWLRHPSAVRRPSFLAFSRIVLQHTFNLPSRSTTSLLDHRLSLLDHRLSLLDHSAPSLPGWYFPHEEALPLFLLGGGLCGGIQKVSASGRAPACSGEFRCSGRFPAGFVFSIAYSRHA
jgi:hypothetical protein